MIYALYQMKNGKMHKRKPKTPLVTPRLIRAFLRLF